MAGIDSIVAGIKTRLETISGLTVYLEPPESVRQTPCAIILPSTGNYDESMDGSTLHTVIITVLVSKGQGYAEAQDELREYMAITGGSSIRGAINGDIDLGSAVDWSRIVRYYDYGGHEYAGEQYLGVRFELQAYEGG